MTEVTLPTRLLMLGMFGMRLRPVFNQGAAGPGADESFQTELTRLLQPKEFFDAQRFLDTARVSVALGSPKLASQRGARARLLGNATSRSTRDIGCRLVAWRVRMS